jgi:regulator of RNase E activity RraA
MTVDDPGFLARCARLSTSTWSDALDSLGIAGVISGLPHRSGQGRFAAFAVTAVHKVGALGTFDKSDFAVGRMLDAVGPDQVLVVDMGGAAVSTAGGLASGAAKKKGVSAIVIDGGCRDLDEIRATGLWVASRHVVPTTGKTRVKLMSIGAPAMIGGIEVNQGDLIVGDETGIVRVARDEAARVLSVAEAKYEEDLAVERGLKSGQTFAQAAKAAKYL